MIPIKAHCWRKVFVAYAKMLQSPLHPFMRPRVRSKYWDHYSRSTQPRQTEMTWISWHRLLQSSSSCGQCHKVTCARWSEASYFVNKLWRHLYLSHISWSCEPLKVDPPPFPPFVRSIYDFIVHNSTREKLELFVNQFQIHNLEQRVPRWTFDSKFWFENSLDLEYQIESQNSKVSSMRYTSLQVLPKDRNPTKRICWNAHVHSNRSVARRIVIMWRREWHGLIAVISGAAYESDYSFSMELWHDLNHISSLLAHRMRRYLSILLAFSHFIFSLSGQNVLYDLDIDPYESKEQDPATSN